MNKDFLQGLSKNIRSYGLKFRETGDLKWMVRYAQEGALLEKFAKKKDKDYYRPVTISEFLDGLARTSALHHNDKIQGALSLSIGRALLRFYLEYVDPNDRALRTIADAPLEEALVEKLQVNTDEKKSALRQQFVAEIDGSVPDEKIREKLVDIAGDKQKFDDAIEYVLTRAYIYARDFSAYKNPILWIIDPEHLENLIKTAATQREKRHLTPEQHGPRLTDVIDTFEIIAGRYAIELAKGLERLRQAKNEMGDPNKIPYKSPRKAKTLKGRTEELGASLFVMDAQLDLLKRMYQDNIRFMDAHPSHEYLTWGGKSADKITRNPAVRSRVPKEEITRATQLFRTPPTRKNAAHRKVTMWNGQTQNWGKFDVPQSMVVEHFFTEAQDNPDYVSSLIQKISKWSEAAVNFTKGDGGNVALSDLRRALPGAGIRELVQIRSDIIDMVFQAIPPDAEDAYEQSRLDSDELEFHKGIGADTNSDLFAYQARLEQNMGAVTRKIAEKYQNFLPEQGADRLIAKLVDDARREAQPLSPLDVRNLMSADNLYTLQGKTPGTRKNSVSEAMMESLEQIHQIWKSNEFQERFEKNSIDLESEEEEFAGPGPTDFILSVQDGLQYLKSEQSAALRQRLGIRELFTSGQEYRDEFSEMMHDIFYGKHPDQIQQVLGNVPIDSLYAYLSERFVEVNYDQISCMIACRYGGARENKGLTLEGAEGSEEELAALKAAKGFAAEGDCTCGPFRIKANEASVEQAQKFVNEFYNSLRQTRNLEQLSVETGPGRVRVWHEAAAGIGQTPEHRALRPTINKDEKLDANFAAVFMMGAKYSFGAGFLRNESRNKMKATFAINKKIEDDAIANNKEFVWDDPVNPRPTNVWQLLHVTGAFADPEPNFGREGKGELPQASESVEPGEFSEKADTAVKHLERQMQAAYGAGAFDLIGALRERFIDRREALIGNFPEQSENIIPFDINLTKEVDFIDKEGVSRKKKVYVTNSPYHPEYGAVALGMTPEGTPDIAMRMLKEVRTLNDAHRFIGSLEDSEMPATTKLQVNRMLDESFTSIKEPVFAQTSEFYSYMSEEVLPLIEDAVDSDAVLNKILDLMGGPAPEKNKPKDKPQGKEVIQARKTIMLLVTQMDQLSKSDMPGEVADLAAQLDGIKEKLSESEELHSTISSMPGGVASALAPELKDLARAWNNLEVARRERTERLELMQAEEIGREQVGLDALRPLLENIRRIVSSEDFVVTRSGTQIAPEAVLQFFDMQLGDLAGIKNEEMAVHTAAIPLLAEYLELLNSKLTETKQWDIQLLYDIKGALDRMRAGNFQVTQEG